MNKSYFNKNCKGYDYTPTILPSTKRIIAMGDIHGDFDLCIKLFEIAGLIDKSQNWIGNDTHVVQVGDQIDRCRPFDGVACHHDNVTLNDEASDIRILTFFTKLDKQARKVGGKVISLLGNHELLNAVGEMGYVSKLGLDEFNDYEDPNNSQLIFKSGKEARKYAFKPGNEYGKFLGCTRLGSVIIGSHLFVHAGIVNQLIYDLNIKGKSSLHEINVLLQKWLLGLIDTEYVNKIISSSKSSMFWNRILGSLPTNIHMEDPRCHEHISEVLKILKIGSMIIGHTPQSFTFNEKINSTCSDSVWRVDNGSSKAFDHFDNNLINHGKKSNARKPQVLEIINDTEYNVIF